MDATLQLVKLAALAMLPFGVLLVALVLVQVHHRLIELIELFDLFEMCLPYALPLPTVLPLEFAQAVLHDLVAQGFDPGFAALG